MHYLYLFVAIVGEVIATTALKSSQSFTKLGPSAIVVAGYATAFYFLSLCLEKINIGTAYAIWSGLGIVLIAGAGAIVYKQTLDLAAMVGMALIVAGVLIMNLLSKSAAH